MVMRIFTTKMEQFWIQVFIGLLILASKLKLGEGKREGKELLIRVHVPEYVREGDTAILKCQYDLDDDKLYTMKWYKGSQEFFRFTPKESPPIKTFRLDGLEVDLNLSNSSVLALANVDLNMTARYTCEVTKDFPDYTTAVKTSMMNVIAIPEHKPVIHPERRSVSIGDTLNVNCTSLRSKPIANITWLLNGLPVHPHYLTPEVKEKDLDNKETITAGLNFIVRQQHFIRNRMTLTCQAKMDPNMYHGATDIIISEHDRPKISSVVDNYSSLPSGGKSDNRISSSGSLLTTSAAVPLAQLFLALIQATTTSTHPGAGVNLFTIIFSSTLTTSVFYAS
ncbi:unnamed protein product [Orchesella dallaii]|uniref:Ig-like domain-containing protein n=1 Tax=Orchesella dallaii TaxID=48710 RepID=A0ABP1QF63_9HEXA